MTTYDSIDNVYCIVVGNNNFCIEMENDSLYYLSKDQVRKHVDVTKVLSKL